MHAHAKLRSKASELADMTLLILHMSAGCPSLQQSTKHPTQVPILTCFASSADSGPPCKHRQGCTYIRRSWQDLLCLQPQINACTQNEHACLARP